MKPVVIEIDPAKVVTTSGNPMDISSLSPSEREKSFKKLLDSGLRARLEVQSILTGLLYVNLDFNRDQQAHLTGLSYKGLTEVPSVPPTVDEVLATLEEVMRKIGNLPIEGVVEDLAATLRDVRTLVGSDEAKKSQLALSHSLESAQVILARLEKSLPNLVAHLDATVREVNHQAGPVLNSTQATLGVAHDALESGRIAAGNIADVTEANSDLSASVKEVNRAAASLRELSDYLQRHPESLLFGKPD
jgi:paraquat-inducible protein B